MRLDTPDLAYVAARDSLRLSGGGEDPLRDAAMRSTLTYVLIRQGRRLRALADRLNGRPGTSSR